MHGGGEEESATTALHATDRARKCRAEQSVSDALRTLANGVVGGGSHEIEVKMLGVRKMLGPRRKRGDDGSVRTPRHGVGGDIAQRIR